MKQSPIPIDNTLLISRFQQKELYQAIPTSNLSVAMTELTTHRIRPFFDPLAIKIGLELKLLGAKIINAKVERGYLFHGLENILATSSYLDGLNFIARINQRTPIFYQLAFIAAYEDLFAIDTDKSIKQMRAFALEMARVYHHLCILKDIFTSLETNTLYDLSRSGKNLIKPYYQLFGKILINQEKEPTINDTELGEVLDAILQLIDEIESSFEYEIVLSNRLKKKTILNLSLASSLGLSGAFIRANRCLYDIRSSPSSALDFGLPPKTMIAEGGDALARLHLRIRDLGASLSWLKERLAFFKAEKIPLCVLREEDFREGQERRKNFGVGEIEGPEGHIKMSIFMNNEGAKIVHLRTPAYFIAQALPRLLLYADLYDIPFILASLGISAEEIDK